MCVSLPMVPWAGFWACLACLSAWVLFKWHKHPPSSTAANGLYTRREEISYKLKLITLADQLAKS